MALRQYMIVFCLLLLVTRGNSYSMKYVMDRLIALEAKIESTEKKCDSENKLRRSETEELFRMISELAGGKIPSRGEQLAPDENITPSEQLTTKSPSADKCKTTELSVELQDLKSYIKGVAAEKQQNVKLRSELKSIGKQLEENYTMFESRIKEEIRNFTNDVSDKLTLLVSEERFNNLSDFVTTIQSELRNEERQSLISLKYDVQTSIQKLSNDLRTVNQTTMKNVERYNTVSDSLRIVTNDLRRVNQSAMENAERCNNVSDSLTIVANGLRKVKNFLRIESCRNAPKSGDYDMYIAKYATTLPVYCDQGTDGGGWLVIQRRKDGSVYFERTWADYKIGFGDIENEFWIGNDNLHALTSSGLNELRIDMEDFEGNKAYAKYRNFKVHPENGLYKLEVSGYSGNAGDSFTDLNGYAFSTKDRDNDKHPDINCPEYSRGAWWYHFCGGSNLNGHYYHGGNYPYGTGIYWASWKGSYYYLKTVEMKIR